jgi:hypothetical protein
MSETLAATVHGLRQIADTLADAPSRLLALAPDGVAFGARGPGRFGELGGDLHRLWCEAIDARAREAEAHAARLHELAGSVSRAASGYSEVDDDRRRGWEAP